ncbi:MAG: hypothetical protein HJJLKODD_00822 [Phycisphaerae bacterium]|nr:hypothetical protein [Phycisphaerae bacterium]
MVRSIERVEAAWGGSSSVEGRSAWVKARGSDRGKLIISLLGLLVAGCGPGERGPAEFLPMDRAIEVENINNGPFNRQPLRLYATGSWSGSWVDGEGTRRSGDGSFKMHVVLPTRLCFKAFYGLPPQRLFEVGMNEASGWFWPQLESDICYYDERGALEGVVINQVPVAPQALVDALGWQLLDPQTHGPLGARYRVEPDTHQLIYEEMLQTQQDEYLSGQMYISREYWLSRYEPFLLEQVLYRQTDGQVQMQAKLSDYQPWGESGALYARRVEIVWPLNNAAITIEIETLKPYSDVDHISFELPMDRLQRNPQEPRPGRSSLIGELLEH